MSKVTVYTQGYYAAPKTETMTLEQAAKLLVEHGAFRNFVEAFNAVRTALEANGKFKRASLAPGVYHPIVMWAE